MRVDNILSPRFECVDDYAIAASQIFIHLKFGNEQYRKIRLIYRNNFKNNHETSTLYFCRNFPREILTFNFILFRLKLQIKIFLGMIKDNS